MSPLSHAHCFFSRVIANPPDEFFRFALDACCVFLKIAVSSSVEEFILSSNSAVVASVWVGETRVLSICFVRDGMEVRRDAYVGSKRRCMVSQSEEND